MDLFFQKYAANQVGTRPNLVSIDGGVPGGTDFGLNIGELSTSFLHPSVLVLTSYSQNLTSTFSMEWVSPIR